MATIHVGGRWEFADGYLFDSYGASLSVASTRAFLGPVGYFAGTRAVELFGTNFTTSDYGLNSGSIESLYILKNPLNEPRWYYVPEPSSYLDFGDRFNWSLDGGSISVAQLKIARQSYAAGNFDALKQLLVGGNDTIFLDGGLNNFTLSNGVDAGDGDDVVNGSAIFDMIIGGTGNDQLFAGSGNDFIEGGAGNDLIDGGSGIDTASFAHALGPVSVSLTVGSVQDTVSDGLDTLTGIENLLGSAFNDQLTGNAASNQFEGGAGNDVMNGGAGFDTASYAGASAGVTVDLRLTLAQDTGGAGVDTLINFENLVGSAFSDTLIGTATDNIIEGDSDNITGAAGGSDFIDGGAGVDTVSYAHAFPGVNVDLRITTAQNTGGGGVDTLLNFENIVGSFFHDSLIGNSADNVLNGGGGDDSMVGGMGNDTYYVDTFGDRVNEVAGEGADRVIATIDYALTGNVESLELGLGAIRGTGNVLNNVINGNSASNILNGGAGTDTLIGGLGNDSYYVDVSGDVITENVGEGTDFVYSYLANYSLGANVENGRLVTSGTANLTGNTLNNVLYAGVGNNSLNGGDGTDTLSYAHGVAGATGVTINLAVTAAQATGGSGLDTISGFENLTGSKNNDKLTGTSGSNILTGGLGVDTLVGGSGNDTYYVDDVGDAITETSAGGIDIAYSTYLGTYTLGGYVENGRIASIGITNLTGNTLGNVLYAGAGDNILDGGSGTDTASYLYAGAAVNVSLATNTPENTGGSGADTLLNIENLTGSNYNDTLVGSSGNNVIDGGVGNDSMAGGLGNDTYLVRQTGDVVTENAGEGTDTANSYLTSFTLGTNIENGRISTTGIASLIGNDLANLLYSGAGSNTLNGGAGIDTVSYLDATAAVTVNLGITGKQATGGSGTETLISIERLTGSNYNDILTGNGSSNTLTGGLGRDTLIGNGGNDIFDFNALAEMGLTDTTWDVITDFNTGDKIDLSTLDANTTTVINDAFNGTLVASFTTAGQLRFDSVAHVLYGSTDADADAEFAIQFIGVSSVTNADFLL